MKGKSDSSYYLANNRSIVFLMNVSYKNLPDEFIQWAYRLFLDREPDNQDVIEEKKRNIQDSQQLRKVFLNSEEFKMKNQWYKPPSQLMSKSAIYVEYLTSDTETSLLFNHIQNTWSYLGKTEPHWSVLSSETFKQLNISQTIDSFNETGKNEVKKLLDLLEKNEVNYQSFTSALEYGCGVGRVTRWLAEKFDKVYGYDISASHLSIASKYMKETGSENVQLNQLIEVKDIEKLQQVDFIYSAIVLQHNPPPIINFIIKQFLDSLNEGGVAFFQVPTYRNGYRFSVKEYLNGISQNGTEKIEMHLLPQKQVFEIIREMGCKLLEVIEDDWAGPGYISNTFIVQKPFKS